MEETGVPRENHWPVASHWQTLSHKIIKTKSHNVVYWVYLVPMVLQKHTLYTIRYLLFEWICIYTNILCYELIKNNNILLKQECLLRVLKKFLSRRRIFGSRRRLDIPQAWAGVNPREGIPPSLLAGCPPPENFEILDGRRCNLGMYLRKMKLLIGLKNAGFLGWIFVPLKEKLKKSKLVKMPQN